MKKIPILLTLISGLLVACGTNDSTNDNNQESSINSQQSGDNEGTGTGGGNTSGGGGTTSNMPWRDKDEDYLHWAWRAMQYAHAKHYPGNKLRKSKGY